ncbi:MAG: T9SS type A sorting domain-containing protein [Chlorobi bacterium]|nr:T9SS type A sorting domain-containing protein [Chlorobiota bacterium]
MKKYIFLFVFLAWQLSQAQFDPFSVPQASRPGTQVRFGDRIMNIIRAGDAYWAHHNMFEKSNGLKPYERWKYMWEAYGRANINPAESWLAAVEAEQRAGRPATDDSSWSLVGSTSYTTSAFEGKGRINVIAVDPNNAQVIYIGAPAGGLWKSTDGGQTWTPLTDQLPSLGVSAIAIDPNDSNTIYIGTGDDDAGVTPSFGVFKSTDGGQTWTHISASAQTYVSQILIDPTQSNNILFSSDAGIYKSTDGGQTWNRSLNLSVREMRMHPTNPQIVYAVTPSSFYRSTDGGSTFTRITSGLTNNASRLVLDVTPAAPSKVYILAVNGADFLGVYISNDAGLSFSKTAQDAPLLSGRQSWYDLAITVSNTDPNTIFLGEIDLWKSTDGGDHFQHFNNWNIMNDQYTHADIHFLEYFGGKLYAGTDGGIYVSNDGNAFSPLNDGLAISQFYRISVSKFNQNENIYGGLQDNGGIAEQADNSWNIFHGGDGMDNAVDLYNPRKGYSFIYFGYYLYVTEDGGSTVADGYNGPARGNWVTPLAMNADNELYGGFRKVYRFNNGWQAVTNNNFNSNIEVLKFDYLDPDLLYAADGASLYKSTDRGASFTLLHTFNQNIQAIAIDPISHRVWVAAFDKVYQSDDGQNWTDISTGLPGGVRINDLQFHYFSPDKTLYAANDIGVYRHKDGQMWEVFRNGLPHTVCMDLELENAEGKLWVGTHGRSVWVTDVPSYLPLNDAALSLNDQATIQCNGEQEVQVVLTNSGQNEITGIDYTWTINNQTGSQTWNGSLQSGDTAVLSIPLNINTDLGTVDGEVEIQWANDQNPRNNKIRFHHLINKSETNNFQYDFESSDHELLHYTNTGTPLWERAAPAGSTLNTAASGSLAYCTDADAHYPDQTLAYLYLPCLDFSNVVSAEISFDMNFDIEADYDALYMEFSTDGASWHILGSTNDPNWYNNNSTIGVGPGNQWNGTQAAMTRYSHDLNDLAGQPHVYLRFVMASDASVNGEGAVIDNLQVNAQLGVDKQSAASALQIYPNPAVHTVNIRYKQPVRRIKITDMAGKTVLSRSLAAPQKALRIDVSMLPAGTYLIGADDGQNILYKHFMKK